jgi:hypothetical protein
LDAAGASSADGTRLIIYDCHTGANPNVFIKLDVGSRQEHRRAVTPFVSSQ